MMFFHYVVIVIKLQFSWKKKHQLITIRNKAYSQTWVNDHLSITTTILSTSLNNNHLSTQQRPQIFGSEGFRTHVWLYLQSPLKLFDFYRDFNGHVIIKITFQQQQQQKQKYHLESDVIFLPLKMTTNVMNQISDKKWVASTRRTFFRQVNDVINTYHLRL